MEITRLQLMVIVLCYFAYTTALGAKITYDYLKKEENKVKRIIESVFFSLIVNILLARLFLLIAK